MRDEQQATSDRQPATGNAGPRVSRVSRFLLPVAGALWPVVLLFGCTSDVGPAPPPPPPCDRMCQDGIALRGMRETMKLVFNLTFQGKPVGAHDFMVPCPLGGKARIFGTATSNATQGTTEIDLTYELDGCTLLERDDEPKENYRLLVTGVVRQTGILAVQPSATTALGIKTDALTVTGTVYDPPLPFEENACPLTLAQNGNKLTGSLCGREVTLDL